MPEKLKRCVKHVKDQGKSEDSAWAICVDSTGLKPHKKKKKDVKKAIETLSDPKILKAWEEFKKERQCPDCKYDENGRMIKECPACKGDRMYHEDIDKAWLPYKEWKAKQEKEKGKKKDKKPEKKKD
jgi:hypothetical protein